MNDLKKRAAALLEVKSLVTLSLTVGMLIMLFRPTELNENLLSLFSASYGSVITYFFTRKEREEK